MSETFPSSPPPPNKSKLGCILLTIFAILLGGGGAAVFVCCGGPMALMGMIGIGVKQQQQAAEKKLQAERADESVPAKQVEFVKTVESFYDGYQAAPNELKKSSLRVERRQAISNALDGFSAKGWVGVIKGTGTNSEGNAHIEIRLVGSKNVVVRTRNNALSDVSESTLIANASPLYKSLSALSKGDKIIFDGVFLEGDKDHVREVSLTERGSMLDPEFVMRFSEVKKSK